jgi:hypothetical protein
MPPQNQLLEAILTNHDQKSDQTNSLLEAILANGDKDTISMLLEALVNLKAKELDSVKQVEFVGPQITAIKGVKGEKGYTPQKGKDYWTDKEIKDIVSSVQSQIKIPKDGKDGKDADNEFIIREVLSKIPKPKNGKDADEQYIINEVAKRLPVPEDGKDADETLIVKRVLEKLPKEKSLSIDEIVSSIKGLLSYKDLKDRPDMPKVLGSVKGPGYLREISDVELGNVEPTNGQGLIWDSTTKKWKAGTVSATGGGVETPTGAVNGINTTFTVLNTPQFITLDGQTLYENNGYTLVALTITTDNPPSYIIRSHY